MGRISSCIPYWSRNLWLTDILNHSDLNHGLYIGAFDWLGTIEYQSPPIDPPTVPFKGEIDEVRIYHRILNETDILELPTQYYSELAVLSSPISGLSFKINQVSTVTPYSQQLNHGSHLIEVPVIQIIDGIKYVFQDWSDGVQNNIRKIDLEADLSSCSIPSRTNSLFCK